MRQRNSKNIKPKTIYIVGPTTSGKTALSISIALNMNAEIVCADSQTIRRDMNIATAKPTTEEMRGITHHMLDIINPYEEYSLATYLKASKSIIFGIHKRDKTAIVVGGTGLYVDALFYNYKLPKPTRSLLVARRLLVGLGVDELQGMIKDNGLIMPNNPNNQRHLINVILRAGSIGLKTEPDQESCIIGLDPGRGVIIERINRRVDKMFESGFVDEVRGIVSKYGQPTRSFDAIGYRIVMRHLNGEITEDESKELFKIADRQYAKRQLSWFKRNKNIKWFESLEKAKAYILSVI